MKLGRERMGRWTATVSHAGQIVVANAGHSKVEGGAVLRRGRTVSMQYYSLVVIFRESSHILEVAGVEGGWLRASRRRCGRKVIQKNMVGWVDVFLEVTCGCL